MRALFIALFSFFIISCGGSGSDNGVADNTVEKITESDSSSSDNNQPVMNSLSGFWYSGMSDSAACVKTESGSSKSHMVINSDIEQAERNSIYEYLTQEGYSEFLDFDGKFSFSQMNYSNGYCGNSLNKAKDIDGVFIYTGQETISDGLPAEIIKILDLSGDDVAITSLAIRKEGDFINIGFKEGQVFNIYYVIPFHSSSLEQQLALELEGSWHLGGGDPLCARVGNRSAYSYTQFKIISHEGDRISREERLIEQDFLDFIGFHGIFEYWYIEYPNDDCYGDFVAEKRYSGYYKVLGEQVATDGTSVVVLDVVQSYAQDPNVFSIAVKFDGDILYFGDFDDYGNINIDYSRGYADY